MFGRAGEHPAFSLSSDDLDAQNARRNADSGGRGGGYSMGPNAFKGLTLTNLRRSLASTAALPKE